VVFKVLPLIVAPVVPAFWTLHTIVLLVALTGVTVPLKARGVPAVAAVGTPVMLVTATNGSITVTVQVAVLPPSAVVTMMIAVPAATAVTIPLLFTVATPVLLLLQVTFLFVALAGNTDAMRVDVPPMFKPRVLRFKLTPVTGAVTVTVLLAVLPPSWVDTVMVAFPPPTAVTTPLLTVATLVLLLFQFTFLFVALLGLTVDVRVAVAPPTVILRVDWLSVTPVTGTSALPAATTVTAQVAVLLPSTVVTVIVAFPAAIAVTKPLLFTVATLVLLLLQVTA
jgi:hypothetical protein